MRASSQGYRGFAATPSFSFLRAVTFAVFDAGRALNTVGSPVYGFVGFARLACLHILAADLDADGT